MTREILKLGQVTCVNMILILLVNLLACVYDRLVLTNQRAVFSPSRHWWQNGDADAHKVFLSTRSHSFLKRLVFLRLKKSFQRYSLLTIKDEKSNNFFIRNSIETGLVMWLLELQITYFSCISSCLLGIFQ